MRLGIVNLGEQFLTIRLGRFATRQWNVADGIARGPSQDD